MAYVTPSSPAPASSWSMTDIESRTDPAPARTTSGSTAVLDRDRLLLAHLGRGSRAASRAAPAGTDSGAYATGSCR